MTAKPLCDPEPKLGVWDRWFSKVYLPSCDGLQLKHMYEAMDLLHEHADKIEEPIFFRVADLFNLELESHKDALAIAKWAIELLASRRFKRYLKVT